jgi:hypothetical protein
VNESDSLLSPDHRAISDKVPFLWSQSCPRVHYASRDILRQVLATVFAHHHSVVVSQDCDVGAVSQNLNAGICRRSVTNDVPKAKDSINSRGIDVFEHGA